MDVEDLEPLERLVILKLARHAHDDGTEAFPSVGLVARWSGYTKKSVQTAIDALLYFGFLEQQRPPHQRHPGVYRIVGEVREHATATGKTARVFVLLPRSARVETISTLEAARRWRQSGNERRSGWKPAPPRVEMDAAHKRMNQVRKSDQESRAGASPRCPDRTPEGTEDRVALEAQFLAEPPERRAALRAEAIAEFEIDSGRYYFTPADREERIHAGILSLLANPRRRARKASDVQPS